MGEKAGSFDSFCLDVHKIVNFFGPLHTPREVVNELHGAMGYLESLGCFGFRIRKS